MHKTSNKYKRLKKSDWCQSLYKVNKSIQFKTVVVHLFKSAHSDRFCKGIFLYLVFLDPHTILAPVVPCPFPCNPLMFMFLLSVTCSNTFFKYLLIPSCPLSSLPTSAFTHINSIYSSYCLMHKNILPAWTSPVPSTH